MKIQLNNVNEVQEVNNQITIESLKKVSVLSYNNLDCDEGFKELLKYSNKKKFEDQFQNFLYNKRIYRFVEINKLFHDFYSSSEFINKENEKVLIEFNKIRMIKSIVDLYNDNINNLKKSNSKIIEEYTERNINIKITYTMIFKKSKYDITFTNFEEFVISVLKCIILQKIETSVRYNVTKAYEFIKQQMKNNTVEEIINNSDELDIWIKDINTYTNTLIDEMMKYDSYSFNKFISDDAIELSAEMETL